jgi:hypothetical protein
VNCPRCGAFHQPGAPMCVACGTPLTVSLSGAAPPPAYAAPPPYTPPQAAPSPYAPPYASPQAPPPYASPQAPPPYAPPYAQGVAYPPSTPPCGAAAYPFVAPKTSAMAVIGFIGAFLCNFVGLVLSIIALVRINGSNGQLRGKSLAIAGIILSAIFLVVSIAYRVAK